MQQNNPELRALRHRMEHAEVTNVADVPRFSQLGVSDTPHAFNINLFFAHAVVTQAFRFVSMEQNYVPLLIRSLFLVYQILPSMQPIHTPYKLRYSNQVIGPRATEFAFLAKTFYDLGVVVPMGSDAPYLNLNPLLGMYHAVSRQSVDGTPPGKRDNSNALTYCARERHGVDLCCRRLQSSGTHNDLGRHPRLYVRTSRLLCCSMMKRDAL